MYKKYSIKSLVFLDESEVNLVRYIIETGGVFLSLLLDRGIAAFQVAVGLDEQKCFQIGGGYARWDQIEMNAAIYCFGLQLNNNIIPILQ
jgi:hypothetical protein